jgi:hypothetical protein
LSRLEAKDATFDSRDLMLDDSVTDNFNTGFLQILRCTLSEAVLE